MRRAALLLLVLLHCPAEGLAAERFNTLRAAGVYAAALSFMTPRVLEPSSLAELCAWGLSGIDAIDPVLRTDLSAGTVRLRQQNHLLLSRPEPPADDPHAWARVVAEIQAAAFEVSAPLRAAGTGGVVRGFFDELFNHLDPYSRYTPPEEAEQDRSRRAGQASIGITLTRRDGQIVVLSVANEGPAAEEGIRPGDAILAVDGQATRGRSLPTVRSWLQGPEDTSLTLTWRAAGGESSTAELTRVMVPPETVRAQRIGPMLVLRITDFNNATGTRIANEITVGTVGSNAAQGIVLDVRGNRGGVLRQALLAADSLLGPGVLISTVGRDPNATRIMRSTRGDLAEYLPVVVLVDGRTASAAEVLAAALADRGRAVVVGSTTLGKGLIQTIAPMPDGGELRITWSRILAPRGWPIQALGVMPQICTSLGAESLGKQLDELAVGRAPMAAALARHHAGHPSLTAQQALDLRAPCPAAEGRDADMGVARLLISNPARYAAALLPPLRDTQPAERPARGP